MLCSAIVKSTARRADATFCISVEVTNGQERELNEFIILDELFGELDVEQGGDVSDKLCELDRCADVTAAFMSACASFAYTQSSLRGLYRKLVQKGFSRESSADAIEIVRCRGFVDEEGIALRRVELMLSKLWGRGRIIQKLREEGFPDTALAEASAMLENVDFCENCAKVIEKKYASLPTERREREKMYASLLRFGYSSAEIKAAVSLVSDNE